MNGPAARESERRRFRARAKTGRVVPVARAFPSDELTPVMLFKRMRASGQECFLLESVEGGETIARYTFLGCGPVARLSIRPVRYGRSAAGQRRLDEPPLEALAAGDSPRIRSGSGAAAAVGRSGRVSRLRRRAAFRGCSGSPSEERGDPGRPLPAFRNRGRFRPPAAAPAAADESRGRFGRGPGDRTPRRPGHLSLRTDAADSGDESARSLDASRRSRR